MDPKFANLPGIAYDQPDVYETADNSEQETSDCYEEEMENESIERLHISTKDSYNKFKGKYLTGKVDFSDRLSGKLRCGYDARSGDWELAGEGEKETPIQRCRRLQCEMDELMQELTMLQNDEVNNKEEIESYAGVLDIVAQSKKVLDGLRYEQIFKKESFSMCIDDDLKNLLNQVDEYKKTKNVSGGVIRETKYNYDSSLPLQKSATRIAELEHRLYQLEHLIGAKPEKLNRLAACMGTGNVLESVQQLSTKAALLQPAQLDLIETRLNNIAIKMDSIAEKSSNSGGAGGGGQQQQQESSARDQKILELYEIAKRTEPITQILPEMLNRMQGLESLHNYVTNFTNTIATLKTKHNTLDAALMSNKAMLVSILESFKIHSETADNQIQKLEERLTTVTANLQK